MFAERGIVAVAIGAAVLGALYAGFAPGAWPRGFPLDDAWIHLVYARSIVELQPFCYNPGEPASGFTSPLWVLLLAPIQALGWGVGGVQALGIVAHAAATTAAASLTRRTVTDPAASYATALLVGLSPALATASLSGMEVCATSAALVFGVLALQAERPAVAGGAFAAAVLLRPESLAVGLSVGAWWLVVRRGRAGPELAWLLGPIFLAAAAEACLYAAVSGRFLPATYYFKHQESLADLPARLWTVVSVLLPRAGAFWGLVGFPVALFAAPAARSLLPLVGGLAWLVAACLVINPVDPGAFYHVRYHLPAVPLLLCGAVVGAWRLGVLAKAERRVGMMLAAVGLAVGGVKFPRVATHRANDVRNIDEVQRAMGEYLAAHTSSDARIAATDAGAVRYFSGRPVIDLMGLNTPDFYWQAATYPASHPITHVAVMPAWETPVRPEELQVVERFETRPYTVTSNARMGTQVVAVCAVAGPVELQGERNVTVVCERAGPEPGAPVRPVQGATSR